MGKALEGVRYCFHGQECCGETNCPYFIEHLSDACCLEDCQEQLKADLIELLEEKEPMGPEMEGGGSNWFVVCGDCHAVISEGDKFCRHCGREVRWSGFNLSGVQEGVRDPAPAAVAVQDQQ